MTTPIVRGSSGRGEPLLRLQQPLGRELPAQPLDLREQVALAGDAQVGARNEKAGEEVALPG